MKFVFNILMGLPGSGKSYWVENEFRSEPRRWAQDMSYEINLDEYVNKHMTIEKALETAYNENHIAGEYYTLSSYKLKMAYVCVDGLILTVDDLEKVIEYTRKYITKNVKSCTSIEFIIHHWTENREQCLKNDILRVKYNERKESSKNTIIYARFDGMNNTTFDNIKKKVEEYGEKCKLVKHDVHVSNDFEVCFGGWCESHYNVFGSRCEDETLYSESWCLGGTMGNCWDDEIQHISADDKPNFNRFDEMITKICPDITFLQYNKLYNACVSIEENEEWDYYGGSLTYACYKCDLRKLYYMMQEMGIIKVEEE